MLATNLLAPSSPPVVLWSGADYEVHPQGWTEAGDRFAAPVGRTVRIWDMTGANPVELDAIDIDFEVNQGLHGWDPSGRWLVLGDFGNAILVDTMTREVFRDVAFAVSFSLLWSPGGRWLALGSPLNDGWVLVDLAEPTVRYSLDPCDGIQGANIFLGDAGLICGADVPYFVPLSGGAAGSPVPITYEGVALSGAAVVPIDDQRILYVGDGPEGPAVYAATPTPAGLTSVVRVADGDGHYLQRFGDRAFIADYLSETRVVDLLAPSMTPVSLGGIELVDASRDGLWVAIKVFDAETSTYVYDTRSLDTPVDYQISSSSSDVAFFGPNDDAGVPSVVAYASAGFDVLRIVDGELVRTSIAERALHRVAVQERGGFRFLVDGRVWVESGGDLVPGPTLPCGGFAEAPQPPSALAFY